MTVLSKVMILILYLNATAYYRCIHQFIQITPRFCDYCKRSFSNALRITDMYTNSLKLHLISVTVIHVAIQMYHLS